MVPGIGKPVPCRARAAPAAAPGEHQVPAPADRYSSPTRPVNPPGRGWRLAGFASGYLVVWIAAALPAYGLAWLAGRLAGVRPVAATVLAVAIFAACGGYQLISLKDRCLARCRSRSGSC